MAQNLTKKEFFLSLHQNAGWKFYSLKKELFHVFKAFFLFSDVFSCHSTKTAENDFFNQCLGCAAPKCWSKNTTFNTSLLESGMVPTVFIFIFASWTFLLNCWQMCYCSNQTDVHPNNDSYISYREKNLIQVAHKTHRFDFSSFSYYRTII